MKLLRIALLASFPLVHSASAAESVADRVAAIAVSEINVKDAEPDELIEFIRQKVKIVSFLSAGAAMKEVPAKVTFHSEAKTLGELLPELCDLLRCDAHVTSVGVVFTGRGEKPFPNVKGKTGKVWKIYRPTTPKPKV